MSTTAGGGVAAAFDTGFQSDVGQQRTTNEDAGSVFDLPGAEAAFVVCDGMGGLRAGDVAANEAMRTVRETLIEQFGEAGVDPTRALAEAFRRANEAVNARNREASETPPSTPGGAGDAPVPAGAGAAGDPQGLMGSTCVAGVVKDGVLFLGHAGDSRAYLYRRGHLARLTDDHSFVAERVRAGDMTEAEARVSRFRNIVTRGLGIEETVDPEFRQEPLRAGDLVIACSDGLTTMLDDPEIADLLNAPAIRRASAGRMAAALVDAANRRGGSDNITVAALRAPGAASDDTERIDGGEETPRVLDIDAPQARRSPSPILMLLLGAAIAALLLFLLFMLSPALRQWIGGASVVRGGASAGGVSPVGSGAGAVDYARLVYDPPVRFAEFLARGDLLAYSHDAGLYFVAASSGRVTLLSRTGVALKSIEKLEVADASANVIPPTRVFMASDPQGNVYLSYTLRKVVEKKGADGRLLATIKGFERPEAVAVDEDGNVYVVDFNEVKICRARQSKASTAPRPAPS